MINKYIVPVADFTENNIKLIKISAHSIEEAMDKTITTLNEYHGFDCVDWDELASNLEGFDILIDEPIDIETL